MKPFDPSTESANKTFEETEQVELLTEDTTPNKPKKSWLWHICSRLGISGKTVPTEGDLIDAIRTVDKDEVMRILETSFSLKEHHDIPWLSLAARRESRTIMDLLIVHGVELNTQDHSAAGKGRTALHEVVKRDWEKGIRLLLDARSDFSIKDNNGQTPIELAVQRGSEHGTRLLLEAGASLKDDNGNQLPLLGWVRSPEILNMLVSAGIDLNVGDEAGPFLHGQLKLGHSELVKQMLFYQVNPNVLDKKGRTAAFYLGHMDAKCSKDCLDKLLKAGLDLSIPDMDGNLAAHLICAVTVNKDLVEYVFRFYPEALFEKNSMGKTPQQILEERGLEGLIQA